MPTTPAVTFAPATELKLGDHDDLCGDCLGRQLDDAKQKVEKGRGDLSDQLAPHRAVTMPKH